MRFISCLLVAALLMLATTRGSAQEPKVAEAEPKPAAAEKDNSYFCPLFELMVMTGGTLYYCDLFDQSDCLDEPEATYALGEYEYPCSCIGETEHCCHAAYGGSRPFPGLLSAVPAGFVHRMPHGRARENSKVLSDPEVPFIKFDLGKRTVYAQVFVISLDIAGATGGIPTGNFTRDIYLAFESKANPAGAKSVTAKAADPATSQGNHYAYTAAFPSMSGKTRQILILTVRKGGNEDPPQGTSKSSN